MRIIPNMVTRISDLCFVTRSKTKGRDIIDTVANNSFATALYDSIIIFNIKSSVMAVMDDGRLILISYLWEKVCVLLLWV